MLNWFKFLAQSNIWERKRFQDFIQHRVGWMLDICWIGNIGIFFLGLKKFRERFCIQLSLLAIRGNPIIGNVAGNKVGFIWRRCLIIIFFSVPSCLEVFRFVFFFFFFFFRSSFSLILISLPTSLSLPDTWECNLVPSATRLLWMKTYYLHYNYVGRVKEWRILNIFLSPQRLAFMFWLSLLLCATHFAIPQLYWNRVGSHFLFIDTSQSMQVLCSYWGVLLRLTCSNTFVKLDIYLKPFFLIPCFPEKVGYLFFYSFLFSYCLHLAS